MLEKLTTPADWARAEAMLSSRLVSRAPASASTSTRSKATVPSCSAASPFRPVAALPGIATLTLSSCDHRRAARRRGPGRHRRALPAFGSAMEGRRVGSVSQACGGPDPQPGGIIDHVDVTVIAEEPKVGPHRTAIRARIAEILGVEARAGEREGDDDRDGWDLRVAAKAWPPRRSPASV